MDSENEGAVGGTPFNESSSTSGRNSPVEFSEAHGSPLRFSPKAFGKNSPVAASSLMHSPLSKSKVLELKKGELKERLESLGHEAIGTKVQLQKQLQAVLSPKLLKDQVQREQMDLERQWQREEKDREFQLTKLKMELEADERRELRRLNAKAEEQRLKAEEQRLKAEEQRLRAEEKRLEAVTTEKRLANSIEVKQLQLEQDKIALEAKKLEIGNSGTRSVSSHGDQGMFRVSSALKLIPKFDNGDIENYLRTFEKAVVMNNIPKEQRANLLFPQLSLKGREVFQALDLEEIMDYDVVKERVLLAYERVPEFYRKRFRGMVKEKHETYSTFAFRLGLPFQRWVEGSKAVESVDKLCDLIKMEQFTKALPKDLNRWLIDRKPNNVSEAAKLADEFDVQGKQEPVMSCVAEGYKKPNFGWKANQNSQNSAAVRKVSPTRFGNSNGDKFAEEIVCGYCKKSGHVISRCKRLQWKNNQINRGVEGNWRSTEASVAPIGLVVEPSVACDKVFDKGFGDLCVGVDRRYAPFCDIGCLHLLDGNTVSLCCLRDSGCLQSLLDRKVLAGVEYKELDDKRLVKGISGEILELPLVEIWVESKFVKGKVIFAVLEHGLPEGVGALIGNDIASERELLDVLAITRAQTRALEEERQPVLAQNNAVIQDNAVIEDNVLDGSLSQLFEESVDVVSTFVSHHDLVKLQHAEDEFKQFFVSAEATDSSGIQNGVFEIVNEVLVRRWGGV